MNESDDYEFFLETWEPSGLLRYATLPANLDDPLIQEHLLGDSNGKADVQRATNVTGIKVMSDLELAVRKYEFFQRHQATWSAHFRDYALSQKVAESKLNNYIQYFSKLWVDGRKRRQYSPEMLSIKASIRELDRTRCVHDTEQFVITPIGEDISSLFTPEEMDAIFRANENLLEVFLSDYVDYLGVCGPRTFSDLYIRRGVMMPKVEHIRKELHYLSSYSLSLGPVEQFAQINGKEPNCSGVPSIFSAPIPAVQQRVVAFAPFIEGMELRQLELVVAPPIVPTPLQYLGEHGGLHEFAFL